jgi:HlyD family secretion protein
MKSSSRTAWAAVAGVLVVVAAAAAWWAARGGDARATYRTATIERGSLQAAVSASGTVAPVTQVQISSQVSGQIRELLADFNTEVKQGQLIARLDPETFEYRVRQASADVEAARASVLTAQANVQQALAQSSRAQVEQAEAQRDFERKQGLLAQNFISPAELDTARARVATLAEAAKAAVALVAVARAQAQNAEAIVRQRQAQLEQARVDLERTQIRSPVDGIVIKRSVEVGQTVAASLQAPELFVIARNLDDMQVEAAIDEADIARVRPGLKASFTIDAFPGRSFDGAVKQVRKAAYTSQNVVTYTVVVGFANPGTSVLPGMTANVRVVTDTRADVLKVPNAALRVRIPGVEAAGPAASAPAAAQVAAASGTGGGAFAALRERLVGEVQVTGEQLERIDALMAAQRPRFAELRNVPEDQRPAARERIVAEMRLRIGEQLTPDQRKRYDAMQAELAGRQASRGRVHVLDEGGRPRAYNVRLGVTDGAMTELLAPVPGELREGTPVVTAVLNARPPSGGPRPAGARTPF